MVVNGNPSRGDVYLVKAEIVTIGTEVVIGLVVNTNATWLAQRLTSMGFTVTRVVTVRDEIDEIATAVKEACERARLVVVTGGLGPTEDDITAQAVAKAFGLKATLNKEAEEMVKRRYEELWKSGKVKTPRLTRERVKMAVIPEGSKPIFNRVGTAPGILLRVCNSVILCLPGVPEEMKVMFEDVKPILQEMAGKKVSLSITLYTDATDESSIASVISEVSRLYPGVYVKSRARHKGGLPISVVACAGSEKECKLLLDKVVKELSMRLEKAGVKVKQDKPNS